MDEKKTANIAPDTPDPLADYARAEKDEAPEAKDEAPETDAGSGLSDTQLDNALPHEDTAEKTGGEDVPEDPDQSRPKTETPPVPAEAAPQPEYAGGIWAAIFNGCARLGPLVLLLTLACLCWHDFWRPENAVYCPAEIKGISAFLHGIFTNSWLSPLGLEHNAWISAQWPGFFWFIGLLALIPGLDSSGMLLPAAEALGASFAVLGVWALALAAGFGVRAAFAAGAILLCAPLFAPLPHFMGLAPFATACLLWALFFFYKGWRAHYGVFSLPLGFILTALAALSGGILFLAVPLLASLIFLIWCGSLKRAHAAPALIGFALMLLILGAWLGWVMLRGDPGEYLKLLFPSSIDFSLDRKWFLGLLAGNLGLVPWILMIFGVSWLKVIKNAGKTLGDSRHSNGSAFIWIAWALACAVSIVIPAFHPAAVAIACLGAILLGKAFVHLSRIGNPFFFLLASLCLIVAGAFLLAVHFEATQSYLLSLLPFEPNPLIAPTLLSLSALPYVGGLALLGGIGGLYFARRERHGGGLIYALLLTILLTQLGRLMLVPELAANPDLPLTSYQSVLKTVGDSLAQPAATVPVIIETAPVPQDTMQAPETQIQPAPVPSQPEQPRIVEEVIIVPQETGQVPPAPAEATSALPEGSHASPDEGTVSAPMQIGQPESENQVSEQAGTQPGEPGQPQQAPVTPAENQPEENLPAVPPQPAEAVGTPTQPGIPGEPAPQLPAPKEVIEETIILEQPAKTAPPHAGATEGAGGAPAETPDPNNAETSE